MAIEPIHQAIVATARADVGKQWEHRRHDCAAFVYLVARRNSVFLPPLPEYGWNTTLEAVFGWLGTAQNLTRIEPKEAMQDGDMLLFNNGNGGAHFAAAATLRGRRTIIEASQNLGRVHETTFDRHGSHVATYRVCVQMQQNS